MPTGVTVNWRKPSNPNAVEKYKGNTVANCNTKERLCEQDYHDGGWIDELVTVLLSILLIVLRSLL